MREGLSPEVGDVGGGASQMLPAAPKDAWDVYTPIDTVMFVSATWGTLAERRLYIFVLFVSLSVL